MPDLSGKVAIVTGAGRGIGRSHSLALAAAGAKVVVNDLGGNMDGTGEDKSPAQQVVEEIRAAGGEATYVHLNVTSEADWHTAVRICGTTCEWPHRSLLRHVPAVTLAHHGSSGRSESTATPRG